jgi:ribosomal protein L16/L10AE
MLHPKKTKYTKKGTIKLNFCSNKLQFGDIGLKAVKSNAISSWQIEEATRQTSSIKLNRTGKL